MVGKKYSTDTGYWRFVVEIHNMLRFFGEWCFIRWGRSSKKLISMFCFILSPKEWLRSSQVNIMLARIYFVPAEWWGFKLPWGWESVLRTYPPWRWMVGIQSFPFGTMGRCKLAVTLLGTNISHQKSLLKMIFLFPKVAMLVPWRVVLGLRVNFIPFFPSRSPTSSTTMPPWLHVTWSGKKRLLMKFLAGGLKYFLNFHPYLGKISNLTNIFQMGWNHQPEFGFMIL